MITEKDLQEAIAECEGQRNPTANTCIKLAAFYTIKQHLFPDPDPDNSASFPQVYSYTPAPPAETNYVSYDGGSEFAQAVQSLPEDLAWEIMDELMSTLEVLNPKLYSSTIRKIRAAE